MDFFPFLGYFLRILLNFAIHKTFIRQIILISKLNYLLLTVVVGSATQNRPEMKIALTKDDRAVLNQQDLSVIFANYALTVIEVDRNASKRGTVRPILRE